MKERSVFMIDNCTLYQWFMKQLIKEYKLCDACESYLDAFTAIKVLREASQSGLHLPQLIVLDIHMPLMNGWQFLDTIQQDANLAKLPIILVSGQIEKSNIEQYKLYPNVIGFFQKPIGVTGLKTIFELGFDKQFS